VGRVVAEISEISTRRQVAARKLSLRSRPSAAVSGHNREGSIVDCPIVPPAHLRRILLTGLSGLFMVEDKVGNHRAVG
jgi:hypothetical protein